MDADTYRVDIAYELLAEPDPEQFGQAVEKFVRLLPEGSQTLLVTSTAADATRPDGAPPRSD